MSKRKNTILSRKAGMVFFHGGRSHSVQEILHHIKHVAGIQLALLHQQSKCLGLHLHRQSHHERTDRFANRVPEEKLRTEFHSSSSGPAADLCSILHRNGSGRVHSLGYTTILVPPLSSPINQYIHTIGISIQSLRRFLPDGGNAFTMPLHEFYHTFQGTGLPKKSLPFYLWREG